ncbi:trypsin-like peptidase [Aquabacter spiritensis]|uniref:Trypsin-like peptidase n=2 Tax=Aquabacter spiritensis TaxID=933073 RepID=A0A4R3LUL7_9HYPH|nr:trypsin-like peptidase [Aquabacter spiritensis]
MAELNTPKSSTGTGFFVSWSGYILTNHHVVEKCKVLEAVRPGAPPVPARLVSVDPTNDLALLQVSLRTRELPAFVPRARIGQSVFIYGFPLTQRLASTGNFTTGAVSGMAGVGDDTSRLQFSAPVQPGNSGGPVLDQNGNVMAVVVSVLLPTQDEKSGQGPPPQNANFAIKSSAAITFLEANGVEPNMKLRSTPLEGPALADLAREFTVRIECDLPH